MNKAFELKDVYFDYGYSPVLRDVNLTIYEGDYLGIIGGNGTGKSTLLKLLVGELKPVSGEIEVLGEPISEFNDWTQIGYVPQVTQGGGIHFPIRCDELVLLNLYDDFGPLKLPRKKHYKAVSDALSIVGMEDFRDKNFNTLSGGQKQKILIAKALVNNPKVLIFDEPTVGIDEKAKENFFHILEHLNEDHGITIIMVTHELEVAREHLKRMCKIERHRVEELC